MPGAASAATAARRSPTRRRTAWRWRSPPSTIPPGSSPTIQWGVEAKLPYVDAIPALPGEDTMADQDAAGFLADARLLPAPRLRHRPMAAGGQDMSECDHRRLPVRRGALPRVGPHRQRPHLPLPDVPEGGRQFLRRAGRGAEGGGRMDPRQTLGVSAAPGMSSAASAAPAARRSSTMTSTSPRITLTIGSLDHPERLKPKSQDGIEGRMPWFSELARRA